MLSGPLWGWATNLSLLWTDGILDNPTAPPPRRADFRVMHDALMFVAWVTAGRHHPHGEVELQVDGARFLDRRHKPRKNEGTKPWTLDDIEEAAREPVVGWLEEPNRPGTLLAQLRPVQEAWRQFVVKASPTVFSRNQDERDQAIDNLVLPGVTSSPQGIAEFRLLPMEFPLPSLAALPSPVLSACRDRAAYWESWARPFVERQCADQVLDPWPFHRLMDFVATITETCALLPLRDDPAVETMVASLRRRRISWDPGQSAWGAIRGAAQPLPELEQRLKEGMRRSLSDGFDANELGDIADAIWAIPA